MHSHCFQYDSHSKHDMYMQGLQDLTKLVICLFIDLHIHIHALKFCSSSTLCQSNEKNLCICVPRMISNYHYI